MWFLIILALPVLGIAYISWHLWTLVPLNVGWRCLLIALLVVSFLLLFVNLSRGIDRLPMPLARLVYDVGSSSVIILLYLALFFLVMDLGRLFRLVPREWLFHNYYTTSSLAIALFVLFLLGNIRYHHKTRESLTITSSKTLSAPMRLVMLSDLHLGYHNPRKELARWVGMINREHPDAVLIAGDIIDMSMRPLLEENMAEELRRIEAPVYACLGNHEYFSNEPQAEQFFRDAHIQLLRDSVAVMGDLCVLGRDDRTNSYRMPMEQLAAKADHSRFTILLDHQPYQLEQAEKAGIDFQFSGHTHHGQVWPISWITEAVYECAFGQHQRGNTRYYVSSGMGIWGGKYRIGTRSEYVVLEIENK